MTELNFLRITIDLAHRAKEKGNDPFGSLLTDTAGNLLITAENTAKTAHDCTGHAELNLMREASQKFEREFLATCTLYTSAEPCPMCAGAIYWGGVGRVIFGLSTNSLASLLEFPADNPLLMISCREVFARGKKQIKVIGPLLEDEARKVFE